MSQTDIQRSILISQKVASCVFAFSTGQINYYDKIDLYSDSKRYKEVMISSSLCFHCQLSLRKQTVVILNKHRVGCSLSKSYSRHLVINRSELNYKPIHHRRGQSTHWPLIFHSKQGASFLAYDLVIENFLNFYRFYYAGKKQIKSLSEWDVSS